MEEPRPGQRLWEPRVSPLGGRGVCLLFLGSGRVGCFRWGYTGLGSERGFLGEAEGWARLRCSWLGSGAARRSGVGLRAAVDQALWGEGRPGLILEFKRCRPGRFVVYMTPWDFYAAVGGAADAFSVLTEPFWFCGSPELLAYFASTGKPVLAKDFVVGREQLEAYASLGASAVLLILDMLGWRRLGELYEEARSLGLEVLVETSGSGDAVEAMHSFPEALVGINARDLRSLHVSFERLVAEVERAASRKPVGARLVAESSVDSVEKALRLARAGADALLIGTWAMAEPEAMAGLRQALKGSIHS